MNNISYEQEPEVWKTIENFPMYEVSNLGRVRNKNTKKIFKKRESKNGKYHSVSLLDKYN